MRGQRGRLPVQPLGYVMSTKVIFRRAEVSILAEVCFPRRPHEGQPRSLHVMSVKVDLTFVDENDFQKRGKWYFWSDNSSWGTSSTISMDTNDSLADISELNGERESETNREGDSSWHDDSDVSDQQLDDDHTEEASTSLGNRKQIRNAEKAKVSSETQKGRRAKGKSIRKTTSNNKNNNTKGKPRKAREKTKRKALTLKELDDLVKKLDEKRLMCWNFVSGELKNQYVVQHYKTHRELINEILDDNVSVKSKLKHPPWAYPGHLTSFPAREGGNLINLVFPGVGNLITTNIVNIHIFFKQLKFILETMQN